MFFSAHPARGRRSPAPGRSGRVSRLTAYCQGVCNTPLLAAAYCLGAYLYGSLPFVYLLGRQRNVDLHQVGSGNVGSTNLWAASGPARGAIGWIADASKGLLPIAVARRLGCGEETAGLAGVCGVVGQCWPVFLRFNGGRGISAFVGAASQIDRAAWVASLVPMVAGGLWRVGRRRRRAERSKAVPLGCLVGTLTFPLACRAHGQGTRVAGRRDAAPTAVLLTLVILLRRLTAPLPDDATHGPAVRPRALV